MPLFDNDAEGPTSKCIEYVGQRPPYLPLLSIYHVEEDMEFMRLRRQELGSDEPISLAALFRGVTDQVLTRGMPDEARRLLEDARVFEKEQRKQSRIPFVHPVIIEPADGETNYAAFTRDISSRGIGLLHAVHLQRQRVMVKARLKSDDVVRFKVELLWCISCEAGWYFSGGIFRRGAEDRVA